MPGENRSAHDVLFLNEQTVNARRTESVDAPIILILSNDKTYQQFGRVNIVHLIEKANLSVTLCNKKNEILGFSAFVDYPQVEYQICEDSLWENWIKPLNVEELSMCTPLNSLFMHYFTAQQEFTVSTAKEIIRAVFNAVPETHFVLLLVKLEEELEPALAAVFEKVTSFSTEQGGDYNLYVCRRHKHVPTLHIRKAVVEDTDDLTPLFTKLDPTLARSYGDYFIAEMIEAQDDDNHCLAAEVNGKAVGFMSINSSPNIEFLQENYELAVFHGLAKPHADDVLEKVVEHVEVKPEVASPPEDGEHAEDGSNEHDEHPEGGSDEHEASKSGKHSKSDGHDKEEGEKEKNATESGKEKKGEASKKSGKMSGAGSRKSSQSSSGKSKKSGKGSKGSKKSKKKDKSRSEEEKPEPEPVEIESIEEKEFFACTKFGKSGSDEHDSDDDDNADLYQFSFSDDNPHFKRDKDIVLNPSHKIRRQRKASFKPTFFGESNAFTIQLFCIEEAHEMRSVDFLPKMFGLFPDKDFAIISMPRMVPEFPLVQNFIRVPARRRCLVPHELYVFHRHGLLTSNFQVRKLRSDDVEGVEKLLKGMSKSELILNDIEEYKQARLNDAGNELQVFVADCLQQVVGVCVITREEEIEFVRSHYNIEDFIYFNHHRRDEHGHLHHFVVSPVFQNFSKMFLKEVLRQGNKSCLYYPFYRSSDHMLASGHTLITGLNYLVPVRARRQIVYPEHELGENMPSKRITSDDPPYALNHINRKLTLEPKVVINAAVVVIGASDVAISFLEILCFCPHLRFSNLTLVSPRGLPTGAYEANAQTFTKDDLERMSLQSWVTVIRGVMVAINRGHKQITLEDGSTIAYDYLILCAGQQFQIPQPTGADLKGLSTNHDLTPAQLIRPYDSRIKAPENVIALNSDKDYKHLITWAKEVEYKIAQRGPKDDPIPPVVIYGRNFETYLIVQLLTECGFPGTHIVLMHPPLLNSPVSANDDDGRCDIFNETPVTNAVEKALDDLKVRIHNNVVLANWKLRRNSKGHDEITHISLSTNEKPIVNFACVGFVSLHPRRIDRKTFSALNDSCVVFDGRLTIDADFCTNDPFIRAAGPLTKYSRRYHADQSGFRHENQNSREIGFRLAMSVLPIFDPTLEEAVKPPTSRCGGEGADGSTIDLNKKLVPLYHEPKVLKGELPGGYTYLHVRKPGARSIYELELDKSDHGLEIVTGCPFAGNYFRLHINKYNCVQTITCLVSRKNIDLLLPYTNIIQLYGLHERYINNIVQRHNANLITDLYAYFRQPWALALFHDRFPDFRQEIREILSNSPNGGDKIPSLEAMVNGLVDEDMVIDESQRELLVKHFETVGQRRQVEKRLLNFISYNYYHLPMYAKPGMI